MLGCAGASGVEGVPARQQPAVLCCEQVGYTKVKNLQGSSMRIRMDQWNQVLETLTDRNHVILS